ncbi:MAG: hypothetical protein OHK0029_10810 [Armatimonadaceae bacterium]
MVGTFPYIGWMSPFYPIANTSVTMSRFSHRQPVFSWSSVVILSTLLLAPGVSATVATALWEVLAQRSVAQTTPGSEGARPASQPRRSADEETLHAAKNGATYVIRFDSDPDFPDSVTASIAIWVPTRAILHFPETGLPPHFGGEYSVSAQARTVQGILPPRAPPTLS